MTGQKIYKFCGYKYGKFMTDEQQLVPFCNIFEFRDYHGMCQSIHGGKRLEVYYCHPYRSGERGSNENANSIIRRFSLKTLISLMFLCA